MVKWKSISIPLFWWEKCKDVVASEKYGYKNPTEVVVDAIKDKLKKLGYLF